MNVQKERRYNRLVAQGGVYEPEAPDSPAGCLVAAHRALFDAGLDDGGFLAVYEVVQKMEWYAKLAPYWTAREMADETRKAEWAVETVEDEAVKTALRRMMQAVQARRAARGVA